MVVIGFIGQGFVGGNYADNFEERGHNVVRYDIDKYTQNKDKIKDCDMVLIAVPTPTKPEGFDDRIIEGVLELIGDDKIALIKSTIPIGTTKKMQEKYPNITVMHSPEFLVERKAAYDARNPDRNIIGILDPNDEELKKKAEFVLSTLPKAPYNLITKAENAEVIKYGGNCLFYTKVVFANILYDLIEKHNLDYDLIKEAMMADPRIGKTHLDISHQGGRGAGGHCFIKDFEAFIGMLEKSNLKDQKETCEALRNINLKYLKIQKKI
jgi:UDPglucose 6-dehydrogenase